MRQRDIFIDERSFIELSFFVYVEHNLGLHFSQQIDVFFKTFIQVLFLAWSLIDVQMMIVVDTLHFLLSALVVVLFLHEVGVGVGEVNVTALQRHLK